MELPNYLKGQTTEAKAEEQEK